MRFIGFYTLDQRILSFLALHFLLFFFPRLGEIVKTTAVCLQLQLEAGGNLPFQRLIRPTNSPTPPFHHMLCVRVGV